MNILLLPDSFKDSLTAQEVAYHMERGVKKAVPNAKVTSLSVSDGGEGFLDAVKRYIPDVNTVKSDTVDPLGRKIKSVFLLNPETETAYIELARASGLELLREDERNPMITSTFGTGLQIRTALQMNVNKIYIGLGGSATNDGGCGIAEALGFNFTDRAGAFVIPRGGNLGNIDKVDDIKFDKSIEFFAVNDVQNTLLGTTGAAHTYARQKGASEQEVLNLESGMQNLVTVCKKAFSKDYSKVPGAGAAGGTAFGLKTFLNARFVSGVSFILQLTEFHELLKDGQVDLIITGEGQIDEQTIYGKMVSGLAKEAGPYGVPVAAICGRLDLSPEEIHELGLGEVRQLYDPSRPEGYSFRNAAELIEENTAALLRSIQ